jgi:hypothetical protein
MKLADVIGLAAKIPMVVAGIMGIVSKVKTADKGAKVDAVLDAIPDSVALAEFGVGRDLLNDEAVRAALTKVAALEHDLIEARNALKAVITSSAK